MTGLDATQTNAPGYELPLPEDTSAPAAHPRPREQALSEPMLVSSVQWFCRLRWFVVAVLLAFGLAARSGWFLQRLGLLAPGLWPLVAAAVLAAGNLAFLLHIRFLHHRGRSLSAHANLWAQILMDLAVLTAVVYYCGGPRTYVPFTYLFHIVLACLFFPRLESLLVLLTASALFAASVAAVHAGLLPPTRFLAETPAAPFTWRLAWLGYAAIVAICTVVWYLVAGLSTMVRRRDVELADSNRRLLAAQAERSRHMLSTTHQLKAPFAAIHASTQLILKGYTGTVNAETLDVVERIAARSRRLANEIHEMLQLANLNSTGQQPPPPVLLDLAEVIRWSVALVGPIAVERSVTFRTDLLPIRVWCVEDHLKMLLSNLLSNAVNYSRPGGLVTVQCGAGPDESPWAIVADQGIGIPPEKLPRIFDEYYRTKEAVAHFRESSGLGLAIVREVAALHGIRVRVQSRTGEGTTFTLQFRPAGDGPRVCDESGKEEVNHGLYSDC